MFQLLPYPFKVWITSIVGGSALYVLWLQFFNESTHTVLNGIYPLVYIMAVIGSGLYSFPAFFLFWFAYSFTVKRAFTKFISKSLLVILSSILAFITVRMVPGVDDVYFWSYDNLDLFLCYGLALTAGVVSHKFDTQLPEVGGAV